MCNSSFGNNLRAQHTAYREQVRLAFLVKTLINIIIKPMCNSSFGSNLRPQHTAYREQVRLAFLVKNSMMWKGECLELSCVATQE